MADILLEARPKITQLATIAKAMDADYLTPMKDALDALFSVRGVTTDELIDLAGFQKGQTIDEMADSLADFGLTVAGGKVIVTKAGDIDLSAVRELARLAGSFAEARALVPASKHCVKSDLMSDAAAFPSNFILIVTYEKTVVIPGTKCKSEVETTEETILGVNKSVTTILADNPELTREELTFNIFWFGKPTPAPYLRNAATALGLTDSEYFDAVLIRSSTTYKINIISDPCKQIYDLSDAHSDEDIDDILGRFGTRSPAIKLKPSSEDILKEIQESGVLTAQPGGRRTATGAIDYGSLACQFLAVVNPEDTFSPKGKNDCYEAGVDISKYMAQVTAAVQSVTDTINSLIQEVLGAFMGVINKLTGIIGTANRFLIDLLACIFPAGLSLDLSLPYLDKFLNLLLDGLAVFERFLGLFYDLTAVLAPLACIKASLADLANTFGDFAKSIPGLDCILSAFNFDVCFGLNLNLGRLEAGLAISLIAATLKNLQNLVIALTSFTLSFEANRRKSHSSCVPAETAILMAKLGVRGALLGGGIPI